MEELLILVDENDNEIGSMEKLSVHKEGMLHRAFSVFVFNSRGEVLLQQRADGKYHSPGVWSNTCCSHPRKGETVENAVNRRLMEEMGMQCPTAFAFSFIYKFQFENGLTEYEYDHVYIGSTDDAPHPNFAEVKAYRYISLIKLRDEMLVNPQHYTPWLKICLPQVMKHFI